MPRVEEAGRIGRVSDPRLEARGVTEPHLPLARSCFDRDATGINVSGLDRLSAKAARSHLHQGLAVHVLDPRPHHHVVDAVRSRDVDAIEGTVVRWRGLLDRRPVGKSATFFYDLQVDSLVFDVIQEATIVV